MEKFPGKGGWTYVKIPFEADQSKLPFGMIRVKGTVDQIPFGGKHLMPLGDGNLFLPLPKALRQKLKKEAGETVRIEVYEDTLPTKTPLELEDCLRDVPGKLELFQSWSNAKKSRWITYIFGSKKEEVKAERILKLIDSLV
ncbi:DUF1905 domain-containing protein [Algoriphagus aestuarii]|nr:DUF1905 domain-containing protein [Algoriphagus aestuarii]